MKIFTSISFWACYRAVVCACLLVGAGTQLATAQTQTQNYHNLTTIDVNHRPDVRPESDPSEAALNDNYIHFWNRSNGFVRLRVSYTSRTGKRHSYTFSDSGDRHGSNSNSAISHSKFFKLKICTGCTDFKVESWFMTNAFVFTTFGAKPTWGHHKERTDVPTTSNSYWYVDKYRKLVKNNNISSYSLYEVRYNTNYHHINMWTGKLDGTLVCAITDLPND